MIHLISLQTAPVFGDRTILQILFLVVWFKAGYAKHLAIKVW